MALLCEEHSAKVAITSDHYPNNCENFDLCTVPQSATFLGQDSVAKNTLSYNS